MEGFDMERGTIKYSLILATIGRRDELARFLKNLDEQTYRNFELIVVDQNPDEILVPLLREYGDKFTLLHLRSERGLSRARNIGLQYLSGDVVAFPDDDCWYGPDTLDRLAQAFGKTSSCDGFCGRANDDRRPEDYLFFSRQSGWIDKNNVWLRSTSFSIFLRSEVVRATGSFDESLGVGSSLGRHAAEEDDYLIRAMDAGFRIYYLSDLCVFHRYPQSVYDCDFIKKSYGYSVGFGYVLRKHNYPIWFVAGTWLRAFGGAVVSLLTLNIPKSRYHLAVLKGRVLGWLG
jgi:glycosyltransferase involved in cell wall biosynthesis